MHLQRKILEKYKQGQSEGKVEGQREGEAAVGPETPAPPLAPAQPAQSPPASEGLEELRTLNASAEFVKFTTDVFPRTDCAAPIALPLGVFVKPFGPASTALPLVDLIPPKTQPNERVDIPRCDGCRAYVNPFFVFKDNHQRFQCNICQLEQAVPRFYAAALQSGGQRPELSAGSVEFLANEDYTSRAPKEPTFFFLIDISPSAHKALVPVYALSALKELVRGWRQGGEGVSFGLALFDDLFHVLQVKGRGANLLTVNPAQAQSPFELSNDRFLHYVEHFKEEELLRVFDGLIEMCGFSQAECSLKSMQDVLRLTTEMLCHQGGKVVLVVGSDAAFPAKAPEGDQARRGQFNACEPAFTQIAAEMHKWMIAADVYVFGHDRHKGLASLLEPVRMSGAEPCYYTLPTGEELTRFYNEIIFNCSRPLTWEAVFRLRVSTGWRKTVLANSFGSVGNDLIRPEQLDENFSYYYALEADDRVSAGTHRLNPRVLYLQTSLLYTNAQRKRLIRVHNFALPLTDSPRLVYESMDYQAVTAALARVALQRFPENKPLSDIQVELLNTMKQLFRGVAQHSAPEFQRENLPYLTLAFLGLLKHEVLLAPYITNFKGPAVDRVSFARTLLNKASHDVIFKAANPSLFNLREMGSANCLAGEEGFLYPPPLRLSAEALEAEQVPLVLVDAGVSLHLCVLDREWVSNAGVFAAEEWSEEGIADSAAGSALKLLLQELRSATQRFLFMHTHTDGPAALRPFLIEDRESCGGFIHTYASFYEVFFKGISKVF